MSELDDAKTRLRQAWDGFESKATADDIASVKKTLEHHDTSLFEHDKHSELSLAHSMLQEGFEDKVNSYLDKHYPGSGHKIEHELHKHEIKPKVTMKGGILGLGKYESLDINWTEAAAKWLENYHEHPEFPKPGTWLDMEDNVNIAIFGDWGGGTWHGNDVAKKIAKAITDNSPDYSIHLGDVYYAGESDEERKNLLDLWPEAPNGNFTLNSNHEMYCVGEGYFGTTLKNDLFKQQNGKSFFALENTNWIVVGLDTAFHAERDKAYMNGKICSTQTDFLASVAEKKKSVIVLSHHNPLKMNGHIIKDGLWSQVVDVLGDTLKYWYFGHVHGAAVYKNVKGIQCRLTGHGVIPWGHAHDLSHSDVVSWYENKKPEPSDGVRIQNGFTFVNLNGETLTETFFGEDGLPHWSNDPGN